MSGYLCVDCGIDTSQRLGVCEYYMVHDTIWTSAKCPDGMLCIGCLEIRIGRKLTRTDFIDAPVNHGLWEQSRRLKNRLRS